MASDLFFILAVSLLLTLILETLFALLAGVRTGRGFLLILLTNCVTNPPVVLLHTLFPALWLEILLEVAVVLTEWFIYKHCADFTRRPFGFALSANAFSYLSGEIINFVLSFIL